MPYGVFCHKDVQIHAPNINVPRVAHTIAGSFIIRDAISEFRVQIRIAYMRYVGQPARIHMQQTSASCMSELGVRSVVSVRFCFVMTLLMPLL